MMVTYAETEFYPCFTERYVLIIKPGKHILLF